MATISKPFWWENFSHYYGFSNNAESTFDSTEMLDRLNTYLVPAPSAYRNHLENIQGHSLPPTGKIDIAILTNGHDFIGAMAGNDYISGRAGDDILYGDAGSDIIRGGTGSDLIIGGNENESSNDKDTVSYSGAAAGIILNITGAITYVPVDGDGSYDILYGIENVLGSDFSDQITGQDGANDTISGGGGNDVIRGGSGNDVLIGGSGADQLYGDDGNDILISGKGQDDLYTGSGQDRIIFDAGILGNIAAHSDVVYDFTTGAGGDKLDVSALLHAVGYAGEGIGHYLHFSMVNKDLKIDFDSDGTGVMSAQHLITLNNVNSGNFSVADNLVTQSSSTLYAAILGQSNAKGLSTAGDDGQSGITQLKNGLLALTDYDQVVSVLRDTTGQPIDIAVGGTTVDGNRNTSYGPERVWWYPDDNRPGEVLLRAVDMLSIQMADLRAQGIVTPVFIWAQGEAETRRIGQASNSAAAVKRYEDATLAIFDYLKNQLGDDIEFYVMQTGRYVVEAARNDGLSESGIQQTLKGLALVQSAQEHMALIRDDVHLAANYSDLKMLYDTDPITYSTDVWHTDYEDREIIGDRLADFIAADLGFNHVIRNVGPYPERVLADLTVHNAPVQEGGAVSGPPVLSGTTGDDRLTGVMTGNTIRGLEGVDRLTAMGGDNILIGGFGKDSLVCASGRDTIVFEANLLPDILANADYIARFQTGAGGDRIDVSGLLMAVGYNGTDPFADGYMRLTPDGARTKIYFDADGPGGSSEKYMAMLDGVSPADFSVVNNLVIYPETAAPGISGLVINGSAQGDLIIGTTGDDVINAGGGKDNILAGLGSDILYGGGETDSFIFDVGLWPEIMAASNSSASTYPEWADVIEDFTTGIGGDKINLNMLLERAGYTGSDAVNDHYIQVTSDGDSTRVEFDPDGNGISGSVVLASLTGVSVSSFSYEDNLAGGQNPVIA